MPLRRVIVGCALVAACSAQAADRDPTSGGPTNTAPLSLWSRVAADPPATPLDQGDQAPLFSYLGSDGTWHEAGEMFTRGPVLLVFGARESDMQALERSHHTLEQLGISTALVVDLRAGAAARLKRRLGLTGPVIRDPVRAIGGLYGALDPSSLHHASAYFLVDEHRTIRLVGRGALPGMSELIDSSARALGRPTPESASLSES